MKNSGTEFDVWDENRRRCQHVSFHSRQRGIKPPSPLQNENSSTPPLGVLTMRLSITFVR